MRFFLENILKPVKKLISFIALVNVFAYHLGSLIRILLKYQY